MRVLHVVGSFGVGGVETWLRDLARSSPELTKEWTFCLLGDRVGEVARQLETEGHTLSRCALRPVATFPLRFWSLLRKGRYDVAHSHVLLFSGVVLAIAALAGVRGRVGHGHNSHDGGGEGFLRRAYRWIMRRLLALAATEIVGCSSGAMRWLGAENLGRVLPYGIWLGDGGAPLDVGPTFLSVPGLERRQECRRCRQECLRHVRKRVPPRQPNVYIHVDASTTRSDYRACPELHLLGQCCEVCRERRAQDALRQPHVSASGRAR